MTYIIQRLRQWHECETCGCTGADGYLIYKDDILVVEKYPQALCFNSVDYPYDSAYYDIFEMENITVKEPDCYHED